MDVDELLQAYARNVAFEMGKNTTTSTTELNDYGKRHFSPMQFLGVHPANQTPARTKERCFYIQNVDDSSKPLVPLAGGREAARRARPAV
jgi:hypothetical protein